MSVQDNISPKQGAILRLKTIHKHYGSLHVLDGIDIEVRQQEILTVLGPSGCGKTTLLRTVNGLISYDKGEVLFKGEQVIGPRPATGI
jgi:polar amino acid transport system ATP-binding protein